MRAALESYPEGETYSVIRETAGLNGAQARPALVELENTGVVEKTTITKRAGNGTRESDAYRLARTASEDEEDAA